MPAKSKPSAGRKRLANASKKRDVSQSLHPEPAVKVAPKKRSSGLSLHLLDTEKTKVELAATMALLDPAVWGRQTLVTVADYRIAGISLEVAFNFALEALSKNNPVAYTSVRETLAALAKNAAADHKKPTEK